ncbi:class I SAM-dependent methyltransferase [uncultured Megasphaera sp.]|uniref:class I SAM-dependent methyltransferase n=1 Tax=uncultured Megasphaera sp. TaxID=165188 RepID=UPI002659E071|nr:methyltransferase domain-containing protein [uncultured Megasphaera sp.]
MLDTRSLFFKKFLTDPSVVGSCTPSSHYLARTMLSRLPWNDLDTIVELGAGTGVFTEYIERHRKQNSTFLIIEQDPDMRACLQQRFPSAVFGSHAENLSYLLKCCGRSQASCIISSLPFTVFPADLQHRILQQAAAVLSPGGEFTAIQYSPFQYSLFHRYFPHIHVSFEVRNIPPSFIFHCKK